jgi:hypothetical protein
VTASEAGQPLQAVVIDVRGIDVVPLVGKLPDAMVYWAIGLSGLAVVEPQLDVAGV